jgi:diguanylate cyclase (GGDEF)-like protein/PAS domain S-box-containing protein
VNRVPAGGAAGVRRVLSRARRHRWHVGLAVCAAIVLTQAHLLDPVWSATPHGATMGAAVLLAWAGVLRSPAYRWPAAAVAGGVTFVALGDVGPGALGGLDMTLAGAPLSDVACLLAYLVLWLGLRALLPRDRPEGRRTRLAGGVDAAAVLVALAYVEWELALEVVGGRDLSSSTEALWVLYPLLDAALIALSIRVWASRRSGSAGVVLVAAGLFCWFLADLLHLLRGATPSGALSWVHAGRLLGGLCLGVGIWQRPRRVLPLVRGQGRPLTAPRIWLALAPLLVPAAMQILAHALGADVDPLPGFVATALLCTLAFARATRLLRDQVALRASLHSQARYFSALAANSSDAVVVLDREGYLTHDSPEVARLLGEPEAVRAGRKLTGFAVSSDWDELRALFARVMASPGQVLATEVRIRPDEDRPRWFSVRLVNLTGDPDVGGVVVTLQDVTDRMLAQQEIAHHALHDGLTGLATRALFDDRLEQALHRAQRSDAWPVVLFIDLDRFKAVNDSHGHAFGDELLRETAQRFLTAVRSGDTVARLGGDEFAILLEQGRPAAEADAIAERLLAALGVPCVLGDQRVRISASIGMAVGEAGSTAASLVRDADIAMNGAKAAGKAQLLRFDAEMRAAAVERARLENDLDDAIEQEQFRLVYQPVMDLATRTLVGFEALLRWDHPVLGPVPPGDFVPIAESAGRMAELGRWVLRQACATAARWQRDHPRAGALSMAVNVSGSQLSGDGFTAAVAEELACSGLRPGSLVVALTETALVDDPVKAAAHLQSLRDLGVRLAIDDFGTGYSSLSYLRQFPVDILKIDRSFVSMITEHDEVPPILHGLIELARTLRLELVAEGIETEVQHERLRSERCDRAQGYLYARPLDADEAELQIVALTTAAARRS